MRLAPGAAACFTHAVDSPAGLELEGKTAAALAAQAPLVTSLGQGRLSMEVASMFGHGAAAPAAALLWRYRLLDLLLPLHAAHLARHRVARSPRCVSTWLLACFNCQKPQDCFWRTWLGVGWRAARGEWRLIAALIPSIQKAHCSLLN